MHIPSHRVSQEMASEPASVWYVPANDGAELAVLIKAPAPSLKALIAGCSLKLIFGKSHSFLCTGAIIADVPDAPFALSGVQRESEEHYALARLLHERRAPLFLFNEMDICVAETTISFSEQSAHDALELMGELRDLYIGPFTDDASHALDCFEYTQDPVQYRPNASKIPCTEITPEIGAWSATTNYFYGAHSFQPVAINNPDEGKSLEDTVWAILSSVFPNALFKNSTILKGQKKREFTDVFAFYPHGSFLIEAKDLSIFSSGFQRTQFRRTAGVQKQVKKAIGQLIGACKDFAAGREIYSAGSDLIEVDRTQPPHCIVLITELTPTGSWDEISELLFDTMRDTRAFFHVLDLQELIMLLKGSSGDARLFDYHLMQRAKLFCETKSVLIRSQMSAKDCDP